MGVSLTIPEGALDKGFTEEVFLAVMTEGRDRPRLSDNQTLLSPVVLTGPPRLTFKKPVVLTFGHCALAQNSWEMGVYHCDSLFSGKKVQKKMCSHQKILGRYENYLCSIYFHQNEFCAFENFENYELGSFYESEY